MDRKLSEKVHKAIMALGQALTGPEKKPEEAEALYRQLMDAYHDVHELETDFHDCVNELCLKCGSYRNEHKGACNGCRWLTKRRGW